MILNWVKELITPVSNLIDDLHTSSEEKLGLRNKLIELEYGFASSVLEFETKKLESEAEVLQARAEVIKAETTSDSWLTRSWRPIVILSFAALVILRWLGLADVDSLSEELELKLMSIIQIAIGGYILGRAGEKILPSILDSIRDSKTMTDV